MTFDEAMRAAAKAADEAVTRTARKYAEGNVTDEDDITGVLVGNLDAEFDGYVGGIRWSSSVVRHRRGKAAEEQQIGADMLIHVELDTPAAKYSKGVIIQAKRQDPTAEMTSREQSILRLQCNRMLSITPAAFVLNYTTGDFRFGSATRVAGASGKILHNLCGWTSYRFFLELFRCPVGDPRIISGLVKDLLPIRTVTLSGVGDLTE